MSKFSAGGGTPSSSPIPPVGKTQIQGLKLIIVNDCVFMYDNVYCVDVKSFNTGYSSCKIDLFHEGNQSIMLLQKES